MDTTTTLLVELILPDGESLEFSKVPTTFTVREIVAEMVREGSLPVSERFGLWSERERRYLQEDATLPDLGVQPRDKLRLLVVRTDGAAGQNPVEASRTLRSEGGMEQPRRWRYVAPWVLTGLLATVASVYVSTLLETIQRLEEGLARETARADEADLRSAAAEKDAESATALAAEHFSRSVLSRRALENAELQALDMQEKMKQAAQSVARASKEAEEAREGKREAEIARAREERSRAKAKEEQDRLEKQAQRYRAFTSGQGTRARDREANSLYTSARFQLRYDGSSLEIVGLSMQLNKSSPKFPKIDDGQRFQLRAHLFAGSKAGPAATVCCWTMSAGASYAFSDTSVMKLTTVQNTPIGDQRIAFELKAIPDGTPLLVSSTPIPTLIEQGE